MTRSADRASMRPKKGGAMHVVVHRRGDGHLAHFLRHLFEMVLAMMLGMFAGGAIFVAASGITAQDAIKGHAIAWVSVMAFSMTAPMVAWMRYRGHAWGICFEMGAVGLASDPALSDHQGEGERSWT
jgi:hypothetical protein